MNNQLSHFIDELIREKNFPEMSPEIHAQLKQDTTEQLNQFILNKILEVLSEEDAQTLMNLLHEKNQHGSVTQFTSDHIPNYSDFMANLLPEFRQRYLAL